MDRGVGAEVLLKSSSVEAGRRGILSKTENTTFSVTGLWRYRFRTAVHENV